MDASRVLSSAFFLADNFCCSFSHSSFLMSASLSYHSFHAKVATMCDGGHRKFSRSAGGDSSGNGLVKSPRCDGMDAARARHNLSTSDRDGI